MSTVLYFSTLLLFLHVSYSYILLTANLDDFHAIAKQIAESPVGIQIHKVIRKASEIFNENSGEQHSIRARAEGPADPDSNSEVWVPDNKAKESSDESLSQADEEYLKTRDEHMLQQRRTGNDMVALGKNASYYLQSLKKIFETV